MSGTAAGLSEPRRVSFPAILQWIAGLRLADALARNLESERVRWFVWLPVWLGSGIAAYFALPAEPGWVTALALPPVAWGLFLASRGGLLLRLAAGALLAMSLGFVVAKARTEATRAPVLTREMRAADVRGIVELVEPRPGRGQRITLRVTDIRGVAAGERPFRVRVRAMTALEGLKPGDAVRLKSTLAPPSPPALPGGYDFARTAWFLGIGATGYALAAPTLEPAAPDEGWLRAAKESLERLRLAIGERIRAALPGEAGAIAVSLITGERGGISEETTNAFRDSGLLHILSISGLHMVIMAGAVFVSVRVVLAAFPVIALNIATKKWAAGAALLAAFAYLLMSGASIPTVRAFLMIAIMFLAVMLDRQALAMRNVALSALLVLAAMPESLLDPGFQMSFAAVVSLIAAYETVRERAGERDRGGSLARIAFFLGGIVLSTVIASLAVAPFAAYHFHRSQQFALLANLVAIPICNLIVMPAGLVTLLLMPLGLEWLPLAVMDLGIRAMMWAAETVAALPGAVIRIAEIPEMSFALMVAGGLWLTLWQRRWRALGLVAIGGGLLLTTTGTRPDILVAGEGELVAVRGPDGLLAAQGPRAGGFELTRWLEHDGDGRTPREALRSKTYRCDGAGCTAEVKGFRLAIVRHASAQAEDCARSDILVSAASSVPGCTAPRLVIDRAALRRSGAHAITIATDPETGVRRLSVETVADRRGVRPWSMPPDDKRQWPRETREAMHKGSPSNGGQ